MEDFCKYLGINKTVSLICCMFWIFSAAEANKISAVAGSKVILPYKNKTNNTLTQLIWKMNTIPLFSFTPNKPLHKSKEAVPLKTNMSLSEGDLYALVIERAEKSHTGNYTCEIITDKGLEEQNWELIITEESGNLNILLIAVAVTVPCVCCLIFIIAFAILRRVCKRAGGRSRTAEVREREEDIYENCLETNQRRGYNRPDHHKPRAH